jgi:hypothetical protein
VPVETAGKALGTRACGHTRRRRSDCAATEERHVSGRSTYWIAATIIAIGAVLCLAGFFGPQWITFVGAVVVVVGALYLVFTRSRRG